MMSRSSGIVWRETPSGATRFPYLRVDVAWPQSVLWNQQQFQLLQAIFKEMFSGDGQAWAPEVASATYAALVPENLLCSLLVRVARGLDSLIADPLAELHRMAPGVFGTDWIEVPFVDEFLALGMVQSCHRLIVNAMAQHRSEPELSQVIAGEVAKIKASIGAQYPEGPMQSAIIRARAERIPCRRISRLLPIYGFGHGAHQKQIWKGFSGTTSYLGVITATNKTLANELLQRAGIPVPKQRTVNNWEAAKRAAVDIGFPVVVKPQTTDYGIAVTTGIVSERQLHEAFEGARKHGNVLVERHIAGVDHRILVMKGKALRAYKRIPAHVVGNDVNTVAELMDIAAIERRKVYDLKGYAFASKDDPQVLSMLEMQGLSLSAVPRRGVTVVLRSNANVSTGGTTVSVADIIHPDNLKIAAKAAEALGLDIAGVDFISPDISVSWQENGAAICEVNPTPGMPYAKDTERMLGFLTENGSTDLRIPIILFVGPEHESIACQTALEILAQDLSLTLTTVRSSMVYQGGRPISPRGATPQIAMEMALLDRSTNVLLLCHESPDFGGLPLSIDAVDVAFLSNAGGAALDPQSRQMLADMSLTIIEGDEAQLRDEFKLRLLRNKP